MLIILSPAKSLDFDSVFPAIKSSVATFESDAKFLVQHLKKFTSQDLQSLMSISPKLADLNVARFLNFDKNQSRQAILAFDGDVYDGINKKNYDTKNFEYAQKNLAILSGLYGVLRPLDLIKPYRLEMGTDFKKYKFFIKNLYEFWSDKITHQLNQYPQKTLINLASQEYFSAVNTTKINKKIIEIIFKENKDGALKIIGINAKKARGLMTNFAIKNAIKNPEDLKNFDQENYRFNTKLSSATQWIFSR